MILNRQERLLILLNLKIKIHSLHHTPIEQKNYLSMVMIKIIITDVK